MESLNIEGEVTPELREAVDNFVMGKDKDGLQITTLAHGQLAYAFIFDKLQGVEENLRVRIFTQEILPAARDITKGFTNATLEI